MNKLPDDVINDLWKLISGGNITIYNNSDQLIKARIDTSYPGESGSEYHINPGSNERWGRLKQEVVRICAYSNWHDFKLSPGSVIRLSPEFKLQIVDGNNSFEWDAKQDGPHIS
jgi:hypothetical protein